MASVSFLGMRPPPHSTTTVEVLTPDFRHKDGAIERVARAQPDVYNHNVETVPRFYRRIRPGASYAHSVELLARVKRATPAIFNSVSLAPYPTIDATS